jgi:hypothetical protein
MQNLIHDGPGPANQPPKEYPQDERSRMDHPSTAAHTQPAHPQAQVMNEPERAARKMDVDEDYDDSGEDDKKSTTVPGSGSAPNASAGGNKTPTSASINGLMNAKADGN